MKYYKLQLRKYRLDKALRQQELSRISGVSQTHISDLELEKEDISLTALFKLANALDICYKQLIKCNLCISCKNCAKKFW